ncbi:MAG: hypothetical protein N2450_01480 [bacterium]|nr:hypothetical protein [bacterium]
MKFTVKSNVIVFLFLMIGLLSSNASANVTINLMNFFDNNPDIIYVADLDLLQSGNAPLLFRISIIPDAPIVQPRLRISLFDGSQTLVARGFLNYPGTLNAGQSWTITNLDISTRNYSANWDVMDNVNRFQSQILRTGMIPIDVYTFVFEVGTGPNENFQVIPTSAQRTIRVRGMGYVQLRYPPNDPSGANPLPTNVPFFVWQSSLDSCRLQIAELHPNESPSSAIEGRRLIDQTVHGNSFQYPSFGNISLLPGRTYVWRVIGVVNTSRGYVLVPSEVNVFRIANQISPSVNQLMIALSQLLSGGNWTSILQMVQAGQLDGYALMNNQPITAQTIFDLIGQINAGEASIRSVRVE